MQALNNFRLIGIAPLVFGMVIGGLAGCGEKPGPAESAGKKIDQVTEESLRKMNEAADKAIKELNETTAKLNKEMGEASKMLGKEGKKVGEVIDDATITSKVKAAIFAEPGLKSLQINVDTIKGEVTLSGAVDSQESRDLAEQLAGAVAGVEEVNTRLVIKSIK